MSRFRSFAFALSALWTVAVLLVGCRAKTQLPQPDAGKKVAAAPPADASAPHAGPWIAHHRSCSIDSFLMQRSDGTLVAVSLDGKKESPLVKINSKHLYFDPVTDLLWFDQDSSLSVIDLRSPSPSPILIAQNLPRGIYWHISPAITDTIVGRHSAESQGTCGPDTKAISLDTELTDPLSPWDMDGLPRKIKTVGMRWLTRNTDRPRNTLLSHSPIFNLGAPGSYAGVDPKDRCPGHVPGCGRWLAFGKTRLQLVIWTGREENQCPVYRCLLFDPETKLFSSPTDPLKTGSPKDISPGDCTLIRWNKSVSDYLVEHKVCNVRTGCRDLDGVPLEWLTPGPSIGAI